MSLRLRLVETIVERRSRGKLFRVQSRASGKFYNVRHAMLDVMNAGTDDGVPASILREFNYMKALASPFTQSVVAHEIHGNCVKIQYEHHPANLRDVLTKNQLVNLKFYNHTGRQELVRSLTGGLLKALAWCHSHDLMHRNLKPENILLNDKGEVVLADFSLARQMTR